MLKTININYTAGNKQILSTVSAEFLPGKINMILGPNGSGKSTWLKIFSGEIKQFSGEVFYGDITIQSLKLSDLSKQRAVMSQQTALSFPLPVAEVVMMGRYPHFTFNPGKKDISICNEVMKLLNLSTLIKRNYLTLSGGEKQRVQFARLLAQVWETPVGGYRYIFLDEPLNNLDISYQQEFLQIAKSITDTNTVFVAVMHDINLALQYANDLFFLKEGKLFASGDAVELVNEKLIEEVFGVKSHIIKNPVSNKPVVIFR